MTVGEWNRDSTGGEVLKARQRIGGKTRLRLFSIGDDRRAGLVEACDRVAESRLLGRLELVSGSFSCRVSLDCSQQFRWARNTSNRFGGDGHIRGLVHASGAALNGRSQ